MPSATLTAVTLADENVVFSQAGTSVSGGSFKDITRPLGQPQTLEFAYKIGKPGALGNDHLNIVICNTVPAAAGNTPTVVTGRVTVDVSVPRDSGWTETMTNDLLAELASLLSDANIATISDALVP